MLPKNFYLIIIVLLILVLIGFTVHMNSRISQIELAAIENNRPIQYINTTYQYSDTSTNIGKVEGNGNVIGDNNTVENKHA